MKIIIEATQIELTPALTAYIKEKFQPVGKLLRSFERGSESQLAIEVGKTTRHHRKGPVFRAEANLRLGGRLLRAEAEKEDVRAAIDVMKDELKLQTVHFKEKCAAKSRRGNRTAR